MRHTRFALLALGVAVLSGCDDDTTAPSRPAVGGVRFINALADTNAVDIRMIDQVDWSASANNLNFRAATEHQAAEAKERRIRVFSYRLASNDEGAADDNINNVTQRLLDTTITVRANENTTFLLTGSAREGTVRFVEIPDAPLTLSAGQIAVRVVNASTGAVDAYYTPTATTAIGGTPSVDNLAPLSASSYEIRATGSVAVRVTPDNSTTAAASTAGPNAPTGPTGAAPSAGVNSQGSAFSVYYFPRGVAGSPQNALTTPAVVWFIDRVPLPPTASTAP